MISRMNKSGSRWAYRVLSAPETNLFIFALLLHFVYEVWQSPYFDFYGRPTLAEKIAAINHCTFGDGVITLICGVLVSRFYRSRDWILRLRWQSVLTFIGLGWGYTFISEIYRIRIASLYGVSGFVLPGIGISLLPLIQWIIIPPLILYLSQKQVLGYRKEQ